MIGPTRFCRRAESGMTLVEMLVCIVLTGMVLAPITMAVNLAITTPPQAAGRAIAAAQRSLLIDQWTDDVESAVTISPNTALPTDTDGVSLYSPCRVGSAGGSATDLIVSFSWTDTNYSVFASPVNNAVQIDYQLVYKYASTNGSNVELDRRYRRWSGATLLKDQTTKMIDGFCQTNDHVLNVFNTVPGGLPGGCYALDLVRAQFKMRDAGTLQPAIVNVEAARRQTASGQTPDPCNE